MHVSLTPASRLDADASARVPQRQELSRLEALAAGGGGAVLQSPPRQDAAGSAPRSSLQLVPTSSPWRPQGSPWQPGGEGVSADGGMRPAKVTSVTRAMSVDASGALTLTQVQTTTCVVGGTGGASAVRGSPGFVTASELALRERAVPLPSPLHARPALHGGAVGGCAMDMHRSPSSTDTGASRALCRA
jgi:hypothetical protein